MEWSEVPDEERGDVQDALDEAAYEIGRCGFDNKASAEHNAWVQARIDRIRAAMRALGFQFR